MLVYRGKIDDKRVSEWEGKQRCALQFIEKRAGEGGLNLVEISVPDDVDHTQWQVDQVVEVPVEVYVGQDKKVKYRYAKLPAGMLHKPERSK